jgi:S-DNA-T family DNA segregation ATPase FtsK/SpoIIIE
MPKAQPHMRLIQEIAGIFLIGIGSLIFLALISFDPRDVGFFISPPNEVVNNFIGPAGAYLAAGLVLFIGIASFLVPLVMILGGVGLMIYSGVVDYRFKAIWLVLFMACGAGLLQLFPIFFSFDGVEWPGGFVGYALNDKFLTAFMGKAGAVIVLGVGYFVSLILLFELHPVDLIRKGLAWYAQYRQMKEQERYEMADPLERVELERRKLEAQERKLRKELAKHSKGLEPLPEIAKPRPSPKIIDTTAPAPANPPAPARSKPEAPTPPPAPPAPEPATSEKSHGEKSAPDKPPQKAPTPPPSRPTYEHYHLPEVTLLDANDGSGHSPATKADLEANRNLLVESIRQFGIEVTPGDITRGATITRYEVYPAPGVRVERIASLEKNIARAMKAEKVNILAPIPGKDSVGIEVANSSKAKIVLRDLFESEPWVHTKAKLPIALGKDVYGSVLVADLADMPHLLIAGTTGSGKSVCINCVLLSLLYRFSPDDLKIILVDPKVVELQVYNQLPHLVVPVVTDPKKVLIALRWVINEMEKRYQLMARAGVRNIAAYNARPVKEKQPETLDLKKSLEKDGPDPAPPDELPGIATPKEEEMPNRLPYIVVIIDELADLMATAAADVELAIARLAAKARAAGIHLIIATQTPRAQVITGVIKTNVPCRIAFQVPSALDSRVILDENGAENLLGKGDLLYLPPGSSKLIRAQGAFVSDEEVARVVDFIKAQTKPSYEAEIHNKLSKGPGSGDEELSEEDQELVLKCWEVMRQEKRASTSMFQRRLRIGYNTAAWITDWFEQKGIVGAKDGAKDREILVDLESYDIEQHF